MPEEKQTLAGGEENIFREMDVTFGDVAEAQDVVRTTNWWKLGSAVSKVMMILAGAAFAVFASDGFIKTAESDSFIFTTGLFTKGGVMCSLVNGGADEGFGTASDPCAPLSDLESQVKDKTRALKSTLKDQLSLYLDRKLNSNVLDSALSRFILDRGEKSRIPYVSVLGDISQRIQDTMRETGIGRFQDGIKCSTVSFVQKSITFSCEIKGYPIMDSNRDSSHVTARIAALTFLKNLQTIDKVKLRNSTRSLSSSDNDANSSTTLPIELEYILDVNQL